MRDPDARKRVDIIVDHTIGKHVFRSEKRCPQCATTPAWVRRMKSQGLPPRVVSIDPAL